MDDSSESGVVEPFDSFIQRMEADLSVIEKNPNYLSNIPLHLKEYFTPSPEIPTFDNILKENKNNNNIPLIPLSPNVNHKNYKNRKVKKIFKNPKKNNFNFWMFFLFRNLKIDIIKKIFNIQYHYLKNQNILHVIHL